MFELSLGFTIGKYLVEKIYKKLVEKKPLPDEREDEGIIVLEVARPIYEDVKHQLGDVVARIVYDRLLTAAELPQVAAEVYKAVAHAQRFFKKITLVLSGPIVLAALIGQALGMQHFNVDFAFWQKGSYVRVPDMSQYRKLLF
ncbi:MAG: hypothetical protein DRJ03_03755 [Chloroflexi bacterium]|nr:MAG: hypothetical protein DRJ03_03755 [Chloroflexota bacterium]